MLRPGGELAAAASFSLLNIGGSAYPHGPSSRRQGRRAGMRADFITHRPMAALRRSSAASALPGREPELQRAASQYMLAPMAAYPTRAHATPAIAPRPQA